MSDESEDQDEEGLDPYDRIELRRERIRLRMECVEHAKSTAPLPIDAKTLISSAQVIFDWITAEK